MCRKVVQRFVLSDDGTGASSIFGFKLERSLPSVKACSALYQQVKISKIKIMVKPRYNQALGPINKFPIDYGSWEGNRPIVDGLLFSTTPAMLNQGINYNEALNMWSAKKHSQMGRGWKRVWTPRVIQQSPYLDPAQPVETTQFSGLKTMKAPYFNVNNPALTNELWLPAHMGWFVVFPKPEQPYVSAIEYDVFVTLYTKWKHQYFNDEVEIEPKPEPIE